MKKPNRSKTVRDYMYANPAASPEEIATACSVTKQFVSQVKHEMRKKANIPLRSRKKLSTTKPVEQGAVKISHQKIEPVKEDPLLSNRDVSDLIVGMVEKDSEIERLQEEIIGYKAIIDFLEFQLGLRRNNGATV